MIKAYALRRYTVDEIKCVLIDIFHIMKNISFKITMTPKGALNGIIVEWHIKSALKIKESGRKVNPKHQ